MYRNMKDEEREVTEKRVEGGFWLVSKEWSRSVTVLICFLLL